MTLQKIKFPVGIVRDRSRYAADGAWFDCNRVRFRNGVVQPIGGWEKFNNSQFTGSCRAILPWASLSSITNVGLGTNLKLMVITGGVLTDITPLRKTTNPLAADPVTTVNLSTTITIADTNHGSNPGDYVTISGITGPINNVPASEINKEHVIVTVPTTGTFTVTVTTPANAGGTGGGGAGVAAYQISVGADSGVISGAGWGAGAWSRSTWSSATSTSTSTGTLRIWSLANWGEDMIATPRNGPPYYWDADVGGRATLVSDVVGATSVPTTVRQALVTSQRVLMCFGVNPASSSIQDPLLVRWSDVEDYTDFAPTSLNAAGSLRLNSGSAFISAIETRQEILAWTDVGLHSVRYVGGDFIYGQTLIGQNTDIVGQNARGALGDVVMWMGKDAFYKYDGRIQIVPCSVWAKVFNDFNKSESQKVFAGVNSTYGEITFYYPSLNSTENDKYVTYSTIENAWTFGDLARTAWTDHSLFSYPLGVGARTANDGYVYYHEFGIDDGSTNPSSALGAYVESSPIEIGDGNSFQFVNQLIPDVSFEGSTSPTPCVFYTFKPQNYPGAALLTSSVEEVDGTVTVPIEQFDEIKYPRFRARSFALRVGGSEAGVFWKHGSARIKSRPDGRR
jgi:hypothetical protein